MRRKDGLPKQRRPRPGQVAPPVPKPVGFSPTFTLQVQEDPPTFDADKYDYELTKMLEHVVGMLEEGWKPKPTKTAKRKGK